MTRELSTLEDSATSFLRPSPDRDSARRAFALNYGSKVYASSIDGNAITWGITLVGPSPLEDPSRTPGGPARVI